MPNFKRDAQLRAYRAMMGEETTARQEEAAKLAAGKCICQPRKVKMNADEGRRASAVTVHDQNCPKFKFWMLDV